jgi:hypothetical protein
MLGVAQSVAATGGVTTATAVYDGAVGAVPGAVQPNRWHRRQPVNNIDGHSRTKYHLDHFCSSCRRAPAAELAVNHASVPADVLDPSERARANRRH